MKYKSAIVSKTGGPEVLRVIEHDLRTPSAGEARVKVLASAVYRPDITVRTGEALYSGTPLGQKVPFRLYRGIPSSESWRRLAKV